MRNKIALGLAGGGMALGIALALLKGLALNRTVWAATPNWRRSCHSAHALDTVFQWSKWPFGLASERFTGKSRSAGDEAAPL